MTLHFRDRCGAVNRSSIQYDFHAGAGKSLPWVPEVFSRARRGASFRRPKAEDASGGGMQRLFGFVLRDAFSEGRLSQLGCREANMGLHIRQGSDEGRTTTFHAG